MRFWIITTNVLYQHTPQLIHIEARDEQAVWDLLEQADTYDRTMILDNKQFEKLKEKLGC
jgi:tRNA(Phe) wybutosine-synthesizing methylase Tyw3